MQIRPIADGDFAPAAALMRALSLQFIVHDAAPDKAAMFIDANSEQGLRGFAAAGIVYHVAVVDDAVAGFVAVRERSHLYHMFVARHMHGRGIARALWAVARQCAIDGGGDGRFTVNSSNHAVGVYEAMGFIRTGPRLAVKGLQVNPMRLDAQ
jgi:GNAT superfamily N-acetyltransferase